MVLLWRNAAQVWRAKGYTNTTAADALEERFGTGKGLGRSTIATLVTTVREPCPPDVADFILNGLEVLDEEAWARYLRETANEPVEEPDSRDGDVRAVAKEAAAEIAATVRGWLETAGSKLEALVDGVASSLRGKLDVVERAVAHVDSRLELIEARVERLVEAEARSKSPAEPRRESDTQRILRAVYGSAAVTVIVVVSSCVVTASRQSPPPAPNIQVNVGPWDTANARSPQTRIARSGHSLASEAATPQEGEQVGERKPRARPIPATPPEGLALPPCRGSEEEINGGCWIATKYSPPCPPDQFEHGKGCYIPMGPRPPRDGVGGGGK